MNHVSANRFDWESAKQRLVSLRKSLEDIENFSQERSEQILADRAIQLARVPQPSPSTSQVLEVVRFELGTEAYAVATEFVFELSRISKVTPIPQTEPHFVGVTNLRGHVTTIVDIGKFLGVAGNCGQHTQFLMLGREKPEMGIAVAGVGDVTLLRRDELLEPENVVGIHRELTIGCTGDGRIVFDGRRLLECESLYVDQTD